MSVGGTGVSVGGKGVGVGRTGVAVGGTGVAVGGTGVGVAAGAHPPTKNKTTNIIPVICRSNF